MHIRPLDKVTNPAVVPVKFHLEDPEGMGLERNVIDVKGRNLIQRCRLTDVRKIARRKTIILKRNPPDMHG